MQAVDDDDGDDGASAHRLNYTPYAKATLPSNPVNISLTTDAKTSITGAGSTGVSLDEMGPIGAAVPTKPALSLGKNVSQVWGKKPEPPTPSVPAAPVSHIAPSSVMQSSPSAAVPSHTPAPVASPEAEASRPPTEKEKMAAALFGGFGGGTAAKAPRRTSQQTKAPAYEAPHAAPSDNMNSTNVAPAARPLESDNLLDVMSLDQEPNPSSAGSDIDLLADMTLVTPTTSISSVQPHIQPSASGSVFDAFDDLIAAKPAASLGLSSSSSLVHPSSSISALRPVSLKTSEFGARWSSTPFEAKLSCPCRLRSLPQLRGAIENHDGAPFIGHVESIQNTNEVKFCCHIFALK